VIRVDQMYIAPVKSLALCELTQARLDKPGIAGDRAFFLVDAEGRLFTQRQCAPLVQVRPAYDVATGELTLSFPDGSSVRGVPEPRDATSTRFFGEREVSGRAVTGGWSEALSEFAGRPVRLVRADTAGSSFDGFPLSLCSTASLEALAREAGVDAVDGRRFRQNLYVSGAAQAHEEDTWIGREVRVGQALLRVKMADARCVVTTRSPDTGETDLNTLKLIAHYRTDQPGEVNFGVFCTVAEPGEARLGDAVEPQ